MHKSNYRNCRQFHFLNQNNHSYSSTFKLQFYQPCQQVVRLVNVLKCSNSDSQPSENDNSSLDVSQLVNEGQNIVQGNPNKAKKSKKQSTKQKDGLKITKSSTKLHGAQVRKKQDGNQTQQFITFDDEAVKVPQTDQVNQIKVGKSIQQRVPQNRQAIPTQFQEKKFKREVEAKTLKRLYTSNQWYALEVNAEFSRVIQGLDSILSVNNISKCWRPTRQGNPSAWYQSPENWSRTGKPIVLLRLCLSDVDHETLMQHIGLASNQKIHPKWVRYKTMQDSSSGSLIRWQCPIPLNKQELQTIRAWEEAKDESDRTDGPETAQGTASAAAAHSDINTGDVSTGDDSTGDVSTAQQAVADQATGAPSAQAPSAGGDGSADRYRGNATTFSGGVVGGAGSLVNTDRSYEGSDVWEVEDGDPQSLDRKDVSTVKVGKTSVEVMRVYSRIKAVKDLQSEEGNVITRLQLLGDTALPHRSMSAFSVAGLTAALDNEKSQMEQGAGSTVDLAGGMGGLDYQSGVWSDGQSTGQTGRSTGQGGRTPLGDGFEDPEGDVLGDRLDFDADFDDFDWD